MNIKICEEQNIEIQYWKCEEQNIEILSSKMTKSFILRFQDITFFL